MRKIAFTIDVEKDFGGESYENLKNDVPKLAKMLGKRGIKATFFVTCDCLEKFPGLFRKLKKEGHEIALHGYMHERWDILSGKEREEKLNAAMKCFKRVFGENPIGFRAPQFSADFELVKLLDRKKFLYDSSVVQFPLSQVIFFPSRIGLYLKQMFLRSKIRHNHLKIWEIYVSSFGLPISAFSLRKLPKWIFFAMHELAFIHRIKKWVVFLSHSYEFNGAGLKRIERYFDSYKNAKFVTMSELALEK